MIVIGFINQPMLLRISALVLLAIASMIALPDNASASVVSIENQANCNFTGAPFDDALTPRAMYCVKRAIAYAIEAYYDKLVTFLNPAIYAAIALAMVLFGLKLMSAQVEDLTRDSMTLLFRIAIVLFLITSWRMFYPATFQTIDDLTKLFVVAISGPGTPTVNECAIPALSNANLPPLNFSSYITAEGRTAVTQVIGDASTYGFWFKFDCMVGRLFGVGNVAKYSLATSMIAILGAALFSNVIGLVLFFAGISAIMAVFFVVVRSVFVVLLAYFTLGFAAILAPVFVPMLLFKYTTPYFLKWINLIVQSIIQPVFVMGFLMFAISIFIDLLYGQGLPGTAKPLSTIMGVNPNTGVTQAFDSMTCGLGSASLSSNQVPADRRFESVMGANNTPKDAKQTSNPITSFFAASGVDITSFFKAFTLIGEMWDRLIEYLTTMLALLFLSYVTLKLLYVIPDMAASIAGTVSIGLVRAAAVPLGIDTKLASGMNMLQEAAMAKMTGGASAGGGLSKLTGGMFQAGGMAGGRGGIVPSTIGGAVSGFARGAIGGAKAGFSGGGNKATKIAGGVMRGALGGLRGGVSGMGKGLVQGTKNAGSNVAEMAGGAIKGAPGAAKDALKSIVSDATKGNS
jgi:type IV secretory pathway VirB6-like protein